MRLPALVSKPEWISLLALLIFPACGESWYVSPLHRPPHLLTSRATEDVDIFTVQLPEQPFVEVAIIGSSAGLAGVRQHAARIGCDAIYLLPQISSRYSTTTRATCLAYSQ